MLFLKNTVKSESVFSIKRIPIPKEVDQHFVQTFKENRIWGIHSFEVLVLKVIQLIFVKNGL